MKNTSLSQVNDMNAFISKSNWKLKNFAQFKDHFQKDKNDEQLTKNNINVEELAQLAAKIYIKLQ